MTALDWVVYIALVLGLARRPLAYILGDLADRNIRRHVDAALGPDPTTTKEHRP